MTSRRFDVGGDSGATHEIRVIRTGFQCTLCSELEGPGRSATPRRFQQQLGRTFGAV